MLTLTVVGIGTFWYYRESSKEEVKKSEKGEEQQRPKILSRLERL